MSVLSRLFSGFGANRKATNGKFNTTKNNHNVNPYGRSTVMYGYSIRLLNLWFGEKKLKNVLEDAKDVVSKGIIYNEATYIYGVCKRGSNNNLPCYMNPIYRRAYHQPKHKK